MKFFRRLAIFVVTLCLSCVAFSTAVHAQVGTQIWGDACVYTASSNEGIYYVATIAGIQCLIGNLLSIAITVIGLVGFMMLIIGSFRYLLSGGNAKGTEEGKNTITFAVVGLVVALSAFFILNIVAQFTGVKSILNFKLQVNDGTSTPDTSVTRGNLHLQ